MARPLILIVIDGLTPSMFEAAVGDRRAPTLTLLAEHGQYARATSTFPSLTPVCLSSIATGAHPDVHRIPHLVWYHRGERRIVEYGSSFAAVRAAGMARAILDTIINMNRDHLGRDAVTLFEALEDAGLTAAAINITCYRGRTRHLYAAAVGRWLVTRDGFDFLTYYLPDYDFASHVHGPEGAHEALARSDAAVRALVDAAGGPDEFLERYAVLLCSDHGQTPVAQHAHLETPFLPLSDVIVTASNRAGMIYRAGPRAPEARALAERLDDVEAAEVVLFREGEDAFARRGGEEVRFSPRIDAGWLSDYPDGPARAWAALANPNAGEVIVSAKAGYEFPDLAGGHHVGGGSHGSLERGDSEVPMLTLGLEAAPRSIVEVAPAVLGHFGVELPPYQRPLARAV